MSKNPNYNDHAERLDGVTVIIVNEFAFLGLDTLSQIDSTLRMIWPSTQHRHNMAYGGYHILFIGDSMHLPPVLSQSIYSSFETITTLPKTSQSQKTKYLNWLDFRRIINFAIVLRMNHRTEDPLYQEILSAIWTESFSHNHYLALKVTYYSSTYIIDTIQFYWFAYSN
jgi:hypothetical protein